MAPRSSPVAAAQHRTITGPGRDQQQPEKRPTAASIVEVRAPRGRSRSRPLRRPWTAQQSRHRDRTRRRRRPASERRTRQTDHQRTPATEPVHTAGDDMPTAQPIRQAVMVTAPLRSTRPIRGQLRPRREVEVERIGRTWRADPARRSCRARYRKNSLAARLSLTQAVGEAGSQPAVDPATRKGDPSAATSHVRPGPCHRHQGHENA